MRKIFFQWLNRLNIKNILKIYFLVFASICGSAAFAQTPNLGDPLFCQPQEGTTFLIVNGGSGVFTVDADCYNNNVNNSSIATITTSQGGSLAGTRSGASINWVYTPPTPTFTGTDTFTMAVTTVWNGAGGTGSAGGSSRPGGPATLTITLNVIPATATMPAAGVATNVPAPAGSVSGCSANAGNAGVGPGPSVILGCVKGVVRGTLAPSHGTLTTGGAGILVYTPTPGYIGTDTFQYQAVGINTDGQFALNSGNVTVTVTVSAPPVTVASVNPSSGSTVGGTPITITGSGFTGATGATIGENACTNLVVVSATSITCTTPAGNVGTASVVVTAPGGSNSPNSLFTYFPAVSSSIPTLSQWGLIILSALMALGTLFAMRRKPM